MDKKAYLDYAGPLFQALSENQKQQQRVRKNVKKLRSSYLSEDNTSRATRLLHLRSQAMDRLHEYRQQQIALTTSLFSDLASCL